MRKILLFAISTLIVVHMISCQAKATGPKNVIVLIADGCGYNQVDAASLYQYGQTGVQIYEKFPVIYAMSHYPIDGHGYDPKLAWSDFDYNKKKTTDSAASATAMATGVKTKNGLIGMNKDGKELENIVQRVEKIGKSTGIVSSVIFSHATPACFCVHNKSRRNYEEIAKSMIVDSKLEVIMGCGHPGYDNDGQAISEMDYRFVGGEDVWKSLSEGTLGNDSDGDGDDDPWILVQDQSEFQKLMNGPTPTRIIGIPKVEATLQQSRSGDDKAHPFSVPFTKNVPTLKEMTTAALNVLDEDPDGFFLMVEGGAVDWAGHGNQSGRLIEEEIDFKRVDEIEADIIEKSSIEFINLWESLTQNQKKTLRLIALNDGKNLNSLDSLKKVGLKNASLVSRATDSLMEKEIIVKNGHFIIEDIIFKKWLLKYL